MRDEGVDLAVRLPGNSALESIARSSRRALLVSVDTFLDRGFQLPLEARIRDLLRVSLDQQRQGRQGHFSGLLGTINDMWVRAFMVDNDPSGPVAEIRESFRVYPYTPGAEGSAVASFLAGASSGWRLA